MEDVLLRFPYIGEKMFALLDEKSLDNCRKVCKTWKCFIEDPSQKFKWIEIIKGHEKEAHLRFCFVRTPLEYFISGQKPKWSKLKIQDLRAFVEQLNSEKDKSKLIEMFLEKYAELKVELNNRTGLLGMNIFHLASMYRQSKLVNILLKKSANFKIDLNAKDNRGFTALHLYERSKLGKSAFGIAKLHGRQRIANLIKRKLPNL